VITTFPVYEEYHTVWQNIGIAIRWAPRWLAGDDEEYSFSHMEIIADDRHPLPVTETGYRSHFCHRSDVEAHGGPVGFAIAWLDNEADTPEWKARLAAFRQPSLF